MAELSDADIENILNKLKDSVTGRDIGQSYLLLDDIKENSKTLVNYIKQGMVAQGILLEDAKEKSKETK